MTFNQISDVRERMMVRQRMSERQSAIFGDFQ